MSKQDSQRGYAFLIVAIAVFIAAMLGITVLADYTIKNQQRQADSTRLARVYRAIVGDPAAETFGYLGDMGDYPTTFQDLFQNPGGTAWNGPYLTEDLFNGSTVNDSWGSPMEYDLNLSAGSPDELAIISKGPDHSGSNGVSTPNDRTAYSGVRPSAGSTYTNTSGNSDNVTYPDYSVSASTALQYNPTGTLDYNLVNKDLNQASTIVAACPSEYKIVATSRTRGSADTISIPWAPGVSSNFLQGLWDISITSAQGMGSYFSESVAIYTGRTVSRNIYVEDINTFNTATYTLNVTNNTGKTIDVYDTKANALNSIKSSAGSGTTAISSVPSCNTITVKDHTSPNPVLGTWVTPWGAASTHVISLTRSTATITNANSGNLAARRMIQVYGNGVILGTVYQRQTVQFPNIDQGAPITILDQPGLNIVGSFTMPGSGTSNTY